MKWYNTQHLWVTLQGTCQIISQWTLLMAISTFLRHRICLHSQILGNVWTFSSPLVSGLRQVLYCSKKLWSLWLKEGLGINQYQVLDCSTACSFSLHGVEHCHAANAVGIQCCLLYVYKQCWQNYGRSVVQPNCMECRSYVTASLVIRPPFVSFYYIWPRQ